MLAMLQLQCIIFSLIGIGFFTRRRGMVIFSTLCSIPTIFLWSLLLA